MTINFFGFPNAAFIFFLFQIFWIILLLYFSHLLDFWTFGFFIFPFWVSFSGLSVTWRKTKNSQTYVQSTSFTYSLFSDSSLREFIDFRVNNKQTRYLRGHVRNITINFIHLFMIFSSVGDLKSVQQNPPPFNSGSTAKKYIFFYFRLSWV